MPLFAVTCTPANVLSWFTQRGRKAVLVNGPVTTSALKRDCGIHRNIPPACEHSVCLKKALTAWLCPKIPRRKL